MAKVTEEPDLTTQAGRLRFARMKKFSSMRGAANAFGWNENTYKSHELGIRRGGALSEDDARRYARAFNVSAPWLLTGKGEADGPDDRNRRTVPVVGYVGAGSAAHFYGTGDGELDRVEAPDYANENTVAAEIRGESMGPLLEHWLVFWDEIRTPVTPDLLGHICVVGLPDDRILVKQLKAASAPGLFHLISNNEAPMLDQEILWAAKVKGMQPR